MGSPHRTPISYADISSRTHARIIFEALKLSHDYRSNQTLVICDQVEIRYVISVNQRNGLEARGRGV